MQAFYQQTVVTDTAIKEEMNFSLLLLFFFYWDQVHKIDKMKVQYLYVLIFGPSSEHSKRRSCITGDLFYLSTDIVDAEWGITL